MVREMGPPGTTPAWAIARKASSFPLNKEGLIVPAVQDKIADSSIVPLVPQPLGLESYGSGANLPAAEVLWSAHSPIASTHRSTVEIGGSESPPSRRAKTDVDRELTLGIGGGVAH